MRVRWAVGLLIATIGVAGCGSVGPSKNVSETFTGTLVPNQLDFHEFQFNVGKNGEYSLEYTLTPAVNVFLYTYFGVPNGACAAVQENTLSAPGHVALSGAINPGSWCVGIQDLGAITQDEQFTLTVSHP